MRKLILSAIVLLVLDGIFLSLMSSVFKSQVFDVQKSPLRINPWGAILSYAFIIFGLNYFIIQGRRSVFDAFVLGLVVYGVYETTTLALLHNWRLTTVAIDTLWGGILFAATTAIVYRL